MADEHKFKVTDEKVPEKLQQQEASADENEVADKTSEHSLKEMRAVVPRGIGGLQYVKVLKKTKLTVGKGEVLIRVKISPWLNIQK